MEKTRAAELDDLVQQAAARVHAATSELTRLAAEFEAEDVTYDWGYSSCASWLSVAGGFDPHTGREILRVGAALRSLPKLSAAFAGGELSLDKLRWLTRVASPADEQVWLDIALVTSGAQLIRICREFHNAIDPVAGEELEAKRGLDFSQCLDGLVTITARLLPEEAEIVAAAIEKLQREEPPEEGRNWDQRDADSFVESFRRTLGDSSDIQPAPTRVVIHVDEATLRAGASGRCHGRFRLTAEAARELACDAEVQIQTERDGVPIDLGRPRRLASHQLARAVRARDGGCVFPGCGRRKVHLHHLEHWVDGGKTNFQNLVGLCAFHHHQLHRGAFRIVGSPGKLRFETREGVPIGLPARPARGTRARPTGSPKPDWPTPRLQFGYVIRAIDDAVEFAQARANGTPYPPRL